jgi:hypothetical protein
VRYVTGAPRFNSKTLREFGKRLAAMDTDEYLAEIAEAMRPAVAGWAEFLAQEDSSEQVRRFEEYFYS